MLDFTHHETFEIADNDSNDNTPIVTEDALDPLSLRVVHLARTEGWRSMAMRSTGSRLWHWFLGDIEEPRQLANPRLEMLRNFCTFTLMGDERSDGLATTMLQRGITARPN
ncbi:hypothetical protein [Novosphingobium terrae]|uniref:hypothetical protein n=1 Tax=Novosphingobium terrae TaxID=2726189 RepID=UPI0019811776|nr:hypothetical protein [Novosphingobium terrae]